MGVIKLNRVAVVNLCSVRSLSHRNHADLLCTATLLLQVWIYASVGRNEPLYLICDKTSFMIKKIQIHKFMYYLASYCTQKVLQFRWLNIFHTNGC